MGPKAPRIGDKVAERVMSKGLVALWRFEGAKSIREPTFGKGSRRVKTGFAVVKKVDTDWYVSAASFVKPPHQRLARADKNAFPLKLNLPYLNYIPCILPLTGIQVKWFWRER